MEKSLQATTTGAPQEDSPQRKSEVLEASGASRGLFHAVADGPVFENSTACVYVEARLLTQPG